MKEIVNAYKDKGEDGVKQIQKNGIHVGGERFVVLKAEDRSIYGKKVRTHRKLTINIYLHMQKIYRPLMLFSVCEFVQGREGVIVVKTTQAILVAHYPETVQPGQAAHTVEQLGDYLIGQGY